MIDRTTSGSRISGTSYLIHPLRIVEPIVESPHQERNEESSQRYSEFPRRESYTPNLARNLSDFRPTTGIYNKSGVVYETGNRVDLAA